MLKRRNWKTFSCGVLCGLAASQLFNQGFNQEHLFDDEVRKLPIIENSSSRLGEQEDNTPTFKCPTELLSINTSEPWGWDFTPRKYVGADINISTPTLQPPQIVTFRLDTEKDSTHVKRTLDSLAQYNYSNVCVVASVNGYAWKESGDRAAITKVNMSSLTPSEEGVFTSHLSIWRLGLKYNIPIIIRVRYRCYCKMEC